MWFDDDLTPDGEDPWYHHVGSRLPTLPIERDVEEQRQPEPDRMSG